MTGTDKSDLAYAQHQRQRRRIDRWAVAGIVAGVTVIAALGVPWALGRRQVNSDLRAVARQARVDCWNWTASADGATWPVSSPPESWFGRNAVAGEISIQGEDAHRYFVVESGERYLLASGTDSGCAPLRTTVPPR